MKSQSKYRMPEGQFPGISGRNKMFRRTLCLASSILALLAFGGVANAQGIKTGQSIVSDGTPGSLPKPVNPGGIAKFEYSLTRNNHSGSTGNFADTITYSTFTSITPGVTYNGGLTGDPANPTSIGFTSKMGTGSFPFSIHVASNVTPATYRFTITAVRSGKDQSVATAFVVVAFLAHA